jgi:hypothetical protein
VARWLSRVPATLRTSFTVSVFFSVEVVMSVLRGRLS